MKNFIILLLFGVITASSFGQNLVPNGDFEYKKGRRNSARPWRFVNTVDFFVENGRTPPNTEEWNPPKAKNGIAYVGLRVYPDYREFIQIKLAEKLIESTKYYFEMWISWSDHSNNYAKRFGASIYRKKPSYTSDYFIFTNPPQIEIKDSDGIIQSDSTNWMKVSGLYRAKGGERYLSIGNFSTTSFKDRLKRKKWWSLNFWHHEAYYFVDGVSLVRIEEYSVEKDSILAKNITDSAIVYQNDNYIYSIDKDSTLVMENIQFASSENKLLPRSYKDLELVLEYLNENPTKKIKILGHTDDVGSSSANQKLSEKRAKSVYDYFISNQISKSRVSYRGMGESSPIVPNADSIGRKKNRRVELNLLH
ncbi:MAG: OOP family OmpA-OmpF porin [Salibacteraceae bacterium]|jgi:OOP family OmpA-OmpF porin